MSSSNYSRRGFIKAAGVAAVGLGSGLPELSASTSQSILKTVKLPTSGQPYPSWDNLFSAPTSKFFGVAVEEVNEEFGDGKSGVRKTRRPRDPNTYYSAGGIDGEEEPHSFFLSFEITNNNILCSATSNGILKNPLLYSRDVPSLRRGQQLIAAELLGGSAWSFGLMRKGGEPRRLPMTPYTHVAMVDGLYPRHHFAVDDLQIAQLTFAPDLGGPATENPRALLIALQLRNIGSSPWEGSLISPNIADADTPPSMAWLATPIESPHPRFTEHPVPISPAYEAVLNLNEESWSPRAPEQRVRLGAGESTYLCYALLLGTSPAQVQATARQVRKHAPLDWVNFTCVANQRRYGQLSIPGGDYYADLLRRLVEEDRSAVLFSDTGACFTGGPSGATFTLSYFQPDIPSHDLDDVRTFKARPKHIPAPTGTPWSLVELLGALPWTGIYYRITGDADTLRNNPGLLPYAQQTLEDVMASRDGDPFLFPSKMLWDGPSLGDYNTGSNIMAWLAFDGMARIADEVYHRKDLATAWNDIAVRVHRNLFRYCVGSTLEGPAFYQGVNKDGSFVPGHDGEEAFTTLGAFFGFCDADEPAMIRYAKRAFTMQNPLYAPAVNGIWWDSDSFGNGTTMPGQIALVLGSDTESELLSHLEMMRKLVDLDGSLWWWPYRYPCTDPRVIFRRGEPADTSKCGYAAAVYTALFLTNLLGIYTDVPRQQVSLRPFMPWQRFDWKEARLGTALFSFEYRCCSSEMHASITNHNKSSYLATMELTLPQGVTPSQAKSGGVLLGNITPSNRFGRNSLRTQADIPAGATIELNLQLS